MSLPLEFRSRIAGVTSCYSGAIIALGSSLAQTRTSSSEEEYRVLGVELLELITKLDKLVNADLRAFQSKKV